MKKVFLYCSIFFFTLAGSVALTGALIYNAQELSAYKLQSAQNQISFFDNTNNKVESNQSQKTVICELPDYVRWAFICVEDKDFYNHNGLSYNRIAKAAYKNIDGKKVKEGASTISQQLIKNTHLSSEKTFRRKIREAALAIKLEKKYSKDKILGMYLDAVYFGNGITGIYNASRFYYNKDIAELDIREAAGLAGLLRSPGRFNPLTKEQNFTDRTNLVLNMMYRQGKITKEQYETARVQEITIYGKRNRNDASAYLTAASIQAFELCNIPIETMTLNGYKIYTFFDATVQSVINKVANVPDYQIKTVSGTQADTCIITATELGQINALYTNNRRIPNAKRNFASALKPLVVYAPAIERDAVTPETVIMDSPYISGDFHPRNHDNKFRDEVTVRESLAHSYNIPAVKILEYTGVQNAVDIAKGLGLPLEDETLAISLGGARNGITAMQLLGGFCAIANGGFKTAPSLVRRIENGHGQLIWEYTSPHIRVLSNNTCLTITDMLKDAVKEGTAKKMSSLDFDIASKTGTTERTANGDNTDAVNVSYTPSRVVLVWNGNASMKTENDLPQGVTGGGITTYISRDIQKAINSGNERFTKPIPAKTVSTPPPVNKKINLSGKVGGTGMPTLSFNTVSGKKYSIYKTVSGVTVLMEVIKAETDSEYFFVDTTAPTKQVIEYFVKSGDITSNTIKIYTADPINKTVASKKQQSKHWFF